MSLGGVVGEWGSTARLDLFWPFLELGEWLHVGKEAAFGLGRYRIGTVRWNTPLAETNGVPDTTDNALNHQFVFGPSGKNHALK